MLSKGEEMIDEKLWPRFVRAKRSEHADCYRCPFATVRKWTEPRVDQKRFPGLHESWYEPIEQSEYKPNRESGPCQKCFEGWVDEKRYEGKICVKCGVWVTEKNAGMNTQPVYEDRTVGAKSAVCGQCLTGGKSVEEWAKDVVEKANQKHLFSIQTSSP